MIRTTASASRLIADIRAELAVAQPLGDAGRRVADVVRLYLGHNDLLTAEQQMPDPNEYRQHVVHVEPDGSFSVVALVWLPGQVTPVHDHVSWCVVGVYRGAEEETCFEKASTDGKLFLRPAEISRSERGTATFLTPPGDIHCVRNATDDVAISLHVYGANVAELGTSIRRIYDLPITDAPSSAGASSSAPR